MWTTQLFVAGSIILLQFCLTKLGQILGMRRYEDYSCWSRYLPLVKWMTKTLGRIIEKEISSPDIFCRNVQIEIKLLDITHLVQQCFCSILEQSNPSKTNQHSVWTSEKRPVSTNASWFHSFIRTPSGYHRMEKNCLNSHCQKYFFSKSCSPVAKFPRNVFLFHSENIGSCDPE